MGWNLHLMGNICGDIEFELNCWKFGVTFWGSRTLLNKNYLDYLGSPEKD